MPQYFSLLWAQGAARQGIQEQAQGVQGLAQIVAGCGKKARFRLVGLFRLRLGLDGAR